MTDTQYKSRKLRDLAAPSVAIGGLAPNTLMRWSPTRAVMEQQDHVVATSRRVLAEVSMSGSIDWSVPDGSADPGLPTPVGAQVYPTADWRTVGTFDGRLTPGCQLEAHVLFCPAGHVQKAIGPNWISDGCWGEIRFAVTWSNGASSSGPHYFSTLMPGSALGTYGGGENTAAGADWQTADERLIENIEPPDFALDPAVAELYSEDAEVSIVIQVRGAPRIVHASCYEMPHAYVKLHSANRDISVHAMPDGLAPLVARPVEDPPDGATYQENRFGTVHVTEIAMRQAERLGPRIWHWSSYDEDQTSNWLDAEHDPVIVTATSFVDLFDTSVTGYDPSNAGFVVAGAHAQRHRLCDPNIIARQRYASVPVRVRVDAQMGAGTATVRVQTGRSSWVEVGFGFGARSVHEATGYLESQVHADHAWAQGQVLCRVTAGTLSIWNISIDYGSH